MLLDGLQSVHASLFENVVLQCRGSGNNNLRGIELGMRAFPLLQVQL